ncbi:transglycosylase SLT domain-containing protein, partial [Kingella kingae]|uniref:transglycosylase SLT domain-containing protein n=1 Tax=Kingella kingae TaxID=504 RepID=UPI001E415FC0
MNEISPFFDNRRSNDNGSAHARRALTPNKTVGMTQPRFNDLAAQCSSGIHPNTLQAVARVESRFNPYAIGVVQGALKRQPRTLTERSP